MANLEGEWLERNKWRAYPLVEMLTPIGSVPSGATIKELNTLVVDAFLLPVDRDLKDDDIRLRQIVVSTSVVRFYNVTTSTVINFSSLTSDLSDDGNYYTLSGYDALGKMWLSLIYWKGSPIASALWLTDMPVFSPKAYPVRTAKVDEMAVRAGAVIISLGEVAQMAEGTNIKMDLNPDTPRIQAVQLREPSERPPKHRIVISAIAGEGEGKVSAGCDEPVDSVLTINDQGPIDGNFQFVGDSCYRISRPGGTVDAAEYDAAANTLQIANDCRVCCDCEDFAALLEEIRRLKNEGLAIRALWENIRAAYDEMLAIWQAKLDCVGTDCIAKLYVFSYAGWLVTVQVWIGNPENCLKAGTSIEVSFGGGDYDPIYVPGSGHLYNDQSMYSQVDPTESGGVFTMEDNSSIKGSGYKIFVFTVRMQQSGDRADGAIVNITAEVDMCGQIPEPVGASAGLRANLNRT